MKINDLYLNCYEIKLRNIFLPKKIGLYTSLLNPLNQIHVTTITVNEIYLAWDDDNIISFDNNSLIIK